MFHKFDVDETEYPGDDEILDIADQACFSAFEDFVGVPFYESSLGAYTVWPTESTCEDGDREVVYIAYLEDSTTTESLEGSEL